MKRIREGVIFLGMRENDRILRMRGMKKMEAGVRIIGFKLDRRILWMRRMKKMREKLGKETPSQNTNFVVVRHDHE
jgi:hypothetical protein